VVAAVNKNFQKMHNYKYTSLLALVLFSFVPLSAQDSTICRSLFREGLTIEGGIGYLAVRDEYISGERYLGSVPYFGMTWSKYHETYGFRLHLEYQYTSNLKEYDLSAELKQFRLSLDYLYPIAEPNLFSKTLSVSLGPTAEVYSYNRRQNIVSSQYLRSNVSLISCGLRSEAIWPWTASLEVRAAARLTLLSMGFHSVNSNNSSESTTKPLTPFTGIDADGGIGICYSLTNSVYGSIGYRFDVTRISAWDFFISANDNLTFSLTYGF
jgi:hypothetical protein